jgi:hypothetical protein
MSITFRKTGIAVVAAAAIVFAGVCGYVNAEETYILPVNEQSYQGIPYASGGIGLEEREALTARYGNFSLKLLFAVEGGAYLSDVKVDIADGKGKKVFTGSANGPWFFVKLAPGKYVVTATMKGKEKQNKVNIVKGKKQTTLNFIWK